MDSLLRTHCPRQTLIPGLNTSVSTMLKCISMQHSVKIYGVVHNLWTFSLKYLDWPKWCSANSRDHYAYQWLDNVKINKFAKYDPNIPCGSTIMRVFFKWLQPAEMILSRPSAIKKVCWYTCQWLDNVDTHWYAKCDQNMPCGSKITLSLTANGRTNFHSRCSETMFLFILTNNIGNGRTNFHSRCSETMFLFILTNNIIMASRRWTGIIVWKVLTR